MKRTETVTVEINCCICNFFQHVTIKCMGWIAKKLVENVLIKHSVIMLMAAARRDVAPATMEISVLWV